LRHCRECCAQHHTDAAGLRAAFDSRVLGVLPAPIFVGAHASLLDPLHAALSRIARLLQRVSAPQSGARERMIEIGAGAGTGAKLAAGVLGIAILAGGTVGAVSSPAHHHHRDRQHSPSPPHVIVPAPRPRRVTLHRSPTTRPQHRLPRPSEQHTPGGFSYLGVPTSASPLVHLAAVPVVKQRGGGPFGP